MKHQIRVVSFYLHRNHVVSLSKQGDGASAVVINRGAAGCRCTALAGTGRCLRPFPASLALILSPGNPFAALVLRGPHLTAYRAEPLLVEEDAALEFSHNFLRPRLHHREKEEKRRGVEKTAAQS
jgi:hypothetical protein